MLDVRAVATVRVDQLRRVPGPLADLPDPHREPPRHGAQQDLAVRVRHARGRDLDVPPVREPIRRGKMLPGRAFFVAIAVGTALVIGLAVNLGDDDPNVLDLSTASPVSGQLAAFKDTKPIPGDQRVMVVGDSMSWSVWVGLDDWGKTHDAQFGRYGARLRDRRPGDARLPGPRAQLVPRLRAVAPRDGPGGALVPAGHGARGDRPRRHLAPEVPGREVPEPRRPGVRRPAHGVASSGSPGRSPRPAPRCGGRRSRTSTSRSARAAPATRRSSRTTRSAWTSSTRSWRGALADVPACRPSTSRDTSGPIRR